MGNNIKEMRILLVCLFLAFANAVKFDDDNNVVYEQLNNLLAEEPVPVFLERQKRVAGPTGCGRAPSPPPANTNMTSTAKAQYNVGDIITYRCAPAYMRLVEGSLSVTCQSNGQWSKLPVCQSYTFGCRRSKLAREYKGRVNVTRCGQPCQAWTATSPWAPGKDIISAMANPTMFPEYRNSYDAQNYCRNPDSGESTGPFCYTRDSKVRWGYCDVTYCDGFDIFDEYDRIPGACGCQGEWYNAIRNYGNIKSMEGATLQSCKYECDNNAQCEGMVFDEQQNKCWLKKCTCANNEVLCTPEKHETYYRKKTPPCPGVEFWDRYNQRHCYYSLYNFNLNASMIFDWATSRKLCQDLFPLTSDMVSLESDAEWDFLARNINMLKIPLMYPRVWIGLYRPENVSDVWQWVTPQSPYGNQYVPPLNYSRWAPDEPTNGYEEQCVQAILTAQGSEKQTAVGRWADEACRGRAPVICEAKMPNFRTSSKREAAEIPDEEQAQQVAPPKTWHPRCKTDPCPVFEDEK